MNRTRLLLQKNLSRLLERRGAKVALARETGLSRPSIDGYLDGSQAAGLDALDRIAHALGVTPASLLEESGRDDEGEEHAVEDERPGQGQKEHEQKDRQGPTHQELEGHGSSSALARQGLIEEAIGVLLAGLPAGKRQLLAHYLAMDEQEARLTAELLFGQDCPAPGAAERHVQPKKKFR